MLKASATWLKAHCHMCSFLSSVLSFLCTPFFSNKMIPKTRYLYNDWAWSGSSCGPRGSQSKLAAGNATFVSFLFP